MHRWGILSLLGISVLLHAYFSWHQPFTNDEGAYLYDARILLEGGVSAGDVLTKAPVPIALFAIGELITGKSLFSARIINSIVSIATVIPLFLLLKLLMNKRAAFIGVAIWFFGSGTIIFHTVGHTQAIASLFAVTCLWLFCKHVRTDVDPYVRSGMTSIFLAGVCFALAYMSRKTALAVGVPMALSLFMLCDARLAWRRVSTLFLFGALVVGIPWLVWMYILYGSSGIWQAVGFGYGDILVHSNSIEPWAGSSDRMFTEAMRIGGVYVVLLTAVAVALVRGSMRRDNNPALLIGSGWLAALVVLYALWPTHLVEYLADFIPPIVIAGAASLAGLAVRLHHKRVNRLWLHALLIIFFFINTASLYSVYIKPWTGMFTRDAITQAAVWLKNSVSIDEEIFTAAVIVPYLSGHHVPFHLSHPQWYKYAFISPKNKSIFLPPYSDVEKIVDTQVSWVLRDQLTDYAYPSMNVTGFREVYTALNNTQYRQNPLRVYLKR